MMKNVFTYLLSALAVGLVLTSCIRDEIAECPPMRITVAVKDKNYFNENSVAAKGLIEKKADNLPFREYVSTLYYIVRDEAGKTVAEHATYEVTGDAKEEMIDFPADLPYGKYHVTVWGNLKSEEPLGDDPAAAELEHADAASRDVYLADAVVEYALGSEHHTVELERTKGRLIIQAENLPDYIDLSKKTICDVYSFVAAGLKYDRLTNLTSRTPWVEKNHITTHTLTGPSKGFEQSTLKMAFHDADNVSASGKARVNNSLLSENVKITMERNVITVVKYVYMKEDDPEPDPDPEPEPEPDPDPDPDPDPNPDPDPEPEPNPDPDPEPDPDPDPEPEPGGKFYIYVLVNDNWEIVHKMEID